MTGFFISLDREPPHTSWIHISMMKLPMTQEHFDAAWDCRPDAPSKVKIYGKIIDTPRLMQTYLRPYTFSGLPHTAKDEIPVPFHRYMWWAQHHSFPLPDGTSKKYNFNQMLVNWYENGNNYIGAHGDDEKELADGTPIISISFGATRKFRIREKTTKNIVHDIDLDDGTCVIMGGNMQKTHTHEIVKVNGDKGLKIGPRINITIREFK